MKNLYAYLNGDTTIDIEPIRTALGAEIAKDEAKATENREMYAQVHDLVIDALSDEPMTVAEIWDAISAEVPDGFKQSKLQYALSHYWEADVVKGTNGKVNTYTAK